ncbi:MAG: cytochrome c peroxidase [Bacteroidota bacterium]
MGLLIAGMLAWLLLSNLSNPAASTEVAENPVAEPDDFARILYPDDNPTSAAGLDLGRRLFYDKGLSANGTVSCASCHRPELAFTDGLPLAMGIEGRRSTRNVPGLTNIGYNHFSLFWDGRSPSLEEQALHPLTDPNEMGGHWPDILDYLRADGEYVSAFSVAFDLSDDVEITPELVGRALAQFQRSLISHQSKYDRVLRGEAEFTAQELRGWAIFFDRAEEGGEFVDLPTAECAHCHAAPHFSNQQFFNNGIDQAPQLTEFADPGRGGVTGSVSDNGMFRTPSLRNVALTAPYMHDGRFTTLEEVLEHYNQGGEYAPNRSPNVRPLGLTKQDKADLLVFLQTLTDEQFIQQQITDARQVGYELEIKK